MKSRFPASIVLVLFLFGSCTKEPLEPTFFEPVRGKHVEKLLLSGDRLWIVSSTPSNVMSIVATIPKHQISYVDLSSGSSNFKDDLPGITSIASDNYGSIYVSGYSGKVFSVSDDLNLEEYFVVPGSAINKIVFNADNDLIIATHGSGLIYYTGDDTISYLTSNSVVQSNYFPFIAMDVSSSVWFCQADQFFKVEKTGSLVMDQSTFTVNPKTTTQYLAFDARNYLWFQKYDGIGFRLYRKASDAPWIEVPFPEDTGSGKVKFIKSDSEGRIWICFFDYPKDQMAYYEEGGWHTLDIPKDSIYIYDFVIYRNIAILGTANGIESFPVREE